MTPATSFVLHIEFPTHQPLMDILAAAQEIVGLAEDLDAKVSTSSTGLSRAAAELLADALEQLLPVYIPDSEERQVALLRQRIAAAFTGNNRPAGPAPDPAGR